MTVKQNKESIELFLKKIKDWGFKKTKDESGAYNEGEDLYFMNISGNEYLIFSHHNAKSIWQSGFDIWTAIYTSEDLIGSNNPVEFEEVVFSYNHQNDFHLIRRFIEK